MARRVPHYRDGAAQDGRPDEPLVSPARLDNRNYLDVVVFGMQDATAIRLGSVTGLTSRTLSVPDHLVVAGQLRLLVDPVGSPEAYLSDDIMVNPGDVVVLHVGSVIRQSTWSIRAGAS